MSTLRKSWLTGAEKKNRARIMPPVTNDKENIRFVRPVSIYTRGIGFNTMSTQINP
jgi:hypothetical protein